MRYISVIPNELVLEIIGHLATSPSAMSALSQLNHGFHGVVTPYLYKSMTKASGTAHRRFLFALEENPSLAPLVRAYHTPHGSDARSFSLWQKVQSALLQMNNLKELVVRRESSLCLPPDFWFLPRHNAPFQLERFVWAARSWNTEQAIELLKTQTHINFLCWDAYQFKFDCPIQYSGTLYQQVWNGNEGPRIPPGDVIWRYDTWAIDGGPEIPTPPLGAGQGAEERTWEAIRLAPGIKTFRTFVVFYWPGSTPCIHFQYTRQMNLEDRTVLDGEENWFIPLLPGRPYTTHPYT